jgi:hypothetical protein
VEIDMAVMKNTGDRRAFLATGMGTIVAVGVAPAVFATTVAAHSSDAAWNAALAEWRAARHALETWHGSDEVSDQLCDVEIVAWRKMLNTPSPDRAALKVKLDELLRVERGIDCTNSWEGRDVRQTIADVARLLGDA